MDPYGPVHRTAIMARAMENQIFAVMVNRCGPGHGLTFAGESAVIDPFGRVVASCGHELEQIAVALELPLLAQSREPYYYLGDRRIALRGKAADLRPGLSSFTFAR